MKDWPGNLPQPSVEQVRNEILRVCGIPGPWPKASTRRTSHVFVRHLAVVVFRRVTNLTSGRLAEACGFKAHGTCFGRKSKGYRLAHCPDALAMADKIVVNLEHAARCRVVGHVPNRFSGRQAKQAEAELAVRIAEMSPFVPCIAARVDKPETPVTPEQNVVKQVFTGKPSPFAESEQRGWLKRGKR